MRDDKWPALQPAMQAKEHAMEDLSQRLLLGKEGKRPTHGYPRGLSAAFSAPGSATGALPGVPVHPVRARPTGAGTSRSCPVGGASRAPSGISPWLSTRHGDHS